MGQDALLTITLDSGTKRYSIHGTSTASAYYEARIERVSGGYKAITPGGGTTQIGSVSVTLADADGVLRKQAGTEQFLNRAAKVELIDTETGTTSVLVDGYIKAKRTPSAQFVLDIRDDTLDVLGETFARRVTPDLFLYVPDRTPTKLIPIPFGTVRSSAFSNQGHIPAYLIDPAVGGATFKYVLAQCQLKSNTQATGLYVYRYGELVPESFYTVSYATVDGVSMTFLEFTVDQRERGSLSYNEITYDCKGFTDTGLQSGTLIENPATQLETILETYGPLTSSSDIDQALLAAAEAAYTSAGVVGGGAIVDENETHLSIIDKFNVGFALNFWRTNSGLYGMRFDNAAAPTGYIPHHRDGENILAGSFQGEATPDSAATLELFYAFDHNRRAWDSSKELNDATAQTQLGREVKRRQELWGIRDINDAQTIGEIKLFQERPERLPYRYQIPADLNLELGGGTQVTHFGGQSSDGAGFARKQFRVYGIRTSIDDRKAIQELSVLDAPGLTPTSFADAEPGRESTDIQPTVNGFSSDLIFAEVDYNTVNWAATTQKIYEPGPNGASHTIAAGNTGNMAGETWIYWDPATSLTVLQTTTTKSDISADPKRLLLCKCSPGVGAGYHPIIEPIYGHAQYNETKIKTPTLGDIQQDTGTLNVQAGQSISLKSGGGITVEGGGDIVLNAGGDIHLNPSDTDPSEIQFGSAGRITSPTTNAGIYCEPITNNTAYFRIGQTFQWANIGVYARHATTPSVEILATDSDNANRFAQTYARLSGLDMLNSVKVQYDTGISAEVECQADSVDARIDLKIDGGTKLRIDDTGIGFFGTSGTAKPTVTGARDNPEGALADLLSDLASLGLITDSTTAS